MGNATLIKKSQGLFQDARWPKWTLATALAGVVTLVLWRRLQVSGPQKRLKTATDSDPSLLRKHSTFESYTTVSGHTYKRIRTFYKEHQQASQLPKDLPLLVFTHGLGGNASQFGRLLTSLLNQAPCLAIDLPGCGLSEFSPSEPPAYTTQALAELIAAAISRYRNAESNQKVVLIGHSMGCSINALLGSSTSPLSHLVEGTIIGMVAICPRGGSLTRNESKSVNFFTSIPIPLFDAVRLWDRRGGLASHSVSRVVGQGADEKTRKLQLKYNEQSESGPFLCIMGGTTGHEGMPGKDVWSGVKVPLFLVAGESDSITPASEVESIASWLKSPQTDSSEKVEDEVKAPAVPTTTGDTTAAEQDISSNLPNAYPPRTQSGNVIQVEKVSSIHSFALKTTVFPPPAAHGLMYATATVRILAGMIESFLSDHIDERLGAAWQLHTLTTAGKWDVKNLKKWQAVEACSEPIGHIFRAMKTMREVDDMHSPQEFVKHWSSAVIPDGVAVVMDISHETPVYRPAGLEDGGIEYIKFPTVSKEKPKAEEVDQFIALVDKLRESPKFQPTGNDTSRPTIGVHCHVRIPMSKRVTRTTWLPREVSHRTELPLAPYSFFSYTYANSFAHYF